MHWFLAFRRRPKADLIWPTTRRSFGWRPMSSLSQDLKFQTYGFWSSGWNHNWTLQFFFGVLPNIFLNIFKLRSKKQYNFPLCSDLHPALFLKLLNHSQNASVAIESSGHWSDPPAGRSRLFPEGPLGPATGSHSRSSPCPSPSLSPPRGPPMDGNADGITFDFARFLILREISALYTEIYFQKSEHHSKVIATSRRPNYIFIRWLCIYSNSCIPPIPRVSGCVSNLFFWMTAITALKGRRDDVAMQTIKFF